jgi:hypothetical protein
MAQFFGTEDIKDLTKTSQTTLEWAAGSVLRIGGQAYSVSSALTLDLATDIDTGSVANDTIYYVYAVVVAGVVSLKYSLSDTAPTGFEAYRKIGLFKTDGSAEILAVPKQDNGSVGDIIQSMLTEEQFIEENGAGWVLADGRSVVGSKYATLIGASIPDLRGQFLRGKNNGRSDGQQNPDGDLALGTQTTDAFPEHSHISPIRSRNSEVNRQWENYGTGSLTQNNGVIVGISSSSFSDVRTYGTTNTGSGAETKPKNVTVNFFIKIDDIAI